MGQLTSLRVQNVTEPGKYPYGNGLIPGHEGTRKRGAEILAGAFFDCGQATRDGARHLPRTRSCRRPRRRARCSAKALKGIDPIQERKAVQAALRAEAAKAMTFSKCAELYIASQERGWANPKHRQQWRNTLSTYAYPVIGGMNVADVGVSEVMQILEPI